MLFIYLKSKDIVINIFDCVYMRTSMYLYEVHYIKNDKDITDVDLVSHR